MTDADKIAALEASRDAIQSVIDALKAEQPPVTPPTPEGSITVAPDSGNAPLSVQATFTPIADVDQAQWQFGDGGVAIGYSASHIYQSAGTFDVTCTASNVQGGQATFTTQVVVNAVLPPTPAPTKVVTPFVGPIVRVPLEPQDLAGGMILGRYAEVGGVWEFTDWQDKEDVILQAGADGFLDMTLTTPSGTFSYCVACHSDDRMDKIPDGKVLHFAQEMDYHHYTRKNIAIYWPLNGADDHALVNTRVFSEQLNPFAPTADGLVIFMAHTYWDARVWSKGKQVFGTDLNKDHYKKWGFDGNPFRSSPLWNPNQAAWESYDNGTDADFGKTRPVHVYLAPDPAGNRTRLVIREGDWTKLDAFVPLLINSAHPMTGPGAYHIISNGVADLEAMAAAGHPEPQLLALARLDHTPHRLGPLTLEFVDVIP